MTSSQSPLNQPEHMSIQPAIAFDYGKLENEIRVVVEQRTSEIKNLMRRTIQEIIEIGQKLIDVKAQLGHGNFRIWLKSEFDWSIPTATRFMQVAENFKCFNLKHLDIAASALYLLASPSTPEGARIEALKRADMGEKINYSLAKEIVSQYNKAALSKVKKSVCFDVHAQPMECDLTKSVRQKENETSGTRDALAHLTKKTVESEVDFLSTQDLILSSELKDRLSVPHLEGNREQLNSTTPIVTSILNQTAIADEESDSMTIEIAMKIQKLSPDQLTLLTLAIINSAKNKLNKSQLQTILTAAQKAVN